MHSEFLKDKKQLEEKDAEMQKKYKGGKITEAQYKAWRHQLEQKVQKDVRKLSIILGGANQLATDDVNMEIPEFYSEAENYQTYQTEKELGIDTNYTLVNKNSITRAIYGDFFVVVDTAKDSAWNQRRIRSAITAGIISGESIDDIANRLMSVVGMNERSAYRNARTWIGAAVSGGRQESAEKSVAIGVRITKYWDAVMDLRTRFSHRVLHHEAKRVNEPFTNGGMFPRDPTLPPEERYNCRCEVFYMPEGVEPDFDGQYRNIEGETYDDWKHGKDIENQVINSVIKKMITQGKTDPVLVKALFDDSSLRTKVMSKAMDTGFNEAKGYVEKVQAWAGNSHTQIRQYEQGIITNDYWKPYADAIEGIIDKSPKWNGGITYRAIGVNTKTLSDFYRAKQSGRVIDMHGTSSWTLDKEYAKSKEVTGDKIIFVSQTNEKGTSIIPYSLTPYEKEIMVSKKAKYVIDNIKKINGIVYVYVKEK